MFKTIERNRQKQQGFTLIEMAIVLVVIGLILGMVYKGRQLVASAKVKNAQAGYNKVLAGMNTYFDRYGMFPGDGCGDVTNFSADAPMSCQDGTQNGIINTSAGSTDDVGTAFFNLMKNTEILTEADTKSALGSAWNATGNATSTYIYVDGADLRIVCDLDRKADDGVSDDGDIQASTTESAPITTPFSGETNLYGSDTDCWDQNGNAAIELKVLP